MCDIWKGNGTPRQLDETDVLGLLVSLKKLHTRWVVMSGGEALMNPNLFRLCNILRTEGMKVTILSTGLLLKRYALQVVTRDRRIKPAAGCDHEVVVADLSVVDHRY